MGLFELEIVLYHLYIINLESAAWYLGFAHNSCKPGHSSLVTAS